MLRRATKPLLVVVSAALLAGCGSDEEGTIPSGDADNLINLVNAVEEAVAEQNCDFAEDNADEFVAAVNNLPAEVDDEVKEGLREAGNRMTELSRDPAQCGSSGATGANGEDGEEESSTTSTTVEPETTTETTTTEEETTDEEPTEEEPEEEEEPAGGNGGGNTNPGGGNPPSDPPEVEIEPGTDSGGVVPGEGRTP